MKNEFTEYTEALALKELGFNEPCFGFYNEKDRPNLGYCVNGFQDSTTLEIKCTAPTFSQAFRWFRDEYGLHHVIHQFNFKKDTVEEYLAEVDKTEDGFEYFKTYEECEYFCLKKLIEIVRDKLGNVE